MEPYTLNRNFIKQEVVDGFHSIIWVERYYGDSEVELVVPATPEMIGLLPTGTFLSINESDEVMVLETRNIEDGKLKITGISLLPWMNNRFVRTTAVHKDQTWSLTGVPGWILWAIIYYMCVEGSPYLNGAINTGIPNPQKLAIPGLGLKDWDKSGIEVTYPVPYGPVYNAMRELATGAEIGMQITLEAVTDTAYFLGFRSYKGLNRTSNQTLNPVVRFSPQMDSFANIKELQSIAALKTDVYVFAPAVEKPVPTTPGSASRAGPPYTGFDLRAEMILASDITVEVNAETGEPGPGADQILLNMLMARAANELSNNSFIIAVDGEIVPENQFKYGIHYNLGDIIEVQGNSGVVQTSRITEYIRSQDEGGERAYPTVAALD